MKESNSGSGLLRAVNFAADLVTLSLLWLVCSLPVLTIGMSSAALFHTYEKVLVDGEGRLIPSFFRSCRDNLSIALPAGALLILMSAAMVFFWSVSMRGTSSVLVVPMALSLVVLLLLVCVQCYFYPLTGHYSLSGKLTAALSMRLVFAHLPQSLLLLVMQIACVAGVILYPPLVCILPAAETALAEKMLMPLFKKYIRASDNSTSELSAE